MWTKGELIGQAFSEIGLSSYAFNVAPEEFESALRSLDSMMATWNAKGFHFGYALPTGTSTSSVAQESGLPDSAHEAVYLNLAVRIAPSFGKMVSPDTKQSAKSAYEAMILPFAFPPEQRARTLPLGAGNKPGRTGDVFSAPLPESLDLGGTPLTF